MKIKKFKAVINDKMLFEDLIWMSYRYCVGRGSIAACTHANNLVPLFNYMSPERKAFCAKDIRSQINSIARFKKNVEIEGYNNIYDAYSLIYKYLIDHQDIIENIKNYKFIVNVDNGEVSVEPRQVDPDAYEESILDDYEYMIPWIKLVNYLDPKKPIVSVVYKGEAQTFEGMEYINVFQNNIRLLYMNVKDYEAAPYRNRYIDPKYIVNIE